MQTDACNGVCVGSTLVVVVEADCHDVVLAIKLHNDKALLEVARVRVEREARIKQRLFFALCPNNKVQVV